MGHEFVTFETFATVVGCPSPFRLLDPPLNVMYAQVLLSPSNPTCWTHIHCMQFCPIPNERKSTKVQNYKPISLVVYYPKSRNQSWMHVQQSNRLQSPPHLKTAVWWLPIVTNPVLSVTSPLLVLLHITSTCIDNSAATYDNKLPAGCGYKNTWL